MKSLALLTALCLALPSAVFADEAAAKMLPGQRVLVAGHSFHMPVMAGLDAVVKAAQIAGHQWAGRSSIGGSRVMQHWDLPDEKNIAKTALRAGSVDVLTMAPNWVVPDAAIDRFIDLGLEKNPQLRAFVQASWFPWDGLLPPQRVAKNEDRDAKTIADLRLVGTPFMETIRTQVRETNARLGRPVAFVVPVGEAVLRLREKVIAGEVPGITRQSELFTDPIGHAKAAVLQLGAYCQFACIYHRSPVGLTCFEKPGDEASRQLNQLLQTIAWSTVCEEPLSGLPASLRSPAPARP